MISIQRYLPPHKWETLIEALSYKLPSAILGHSIKAQPIYGHQLGTGSKKVLLWSQMHGNESTTTRALLDLLNYLNTSTGAALLKGLTLMIIPQLNPDGAAAYTRLNANGVDLNRDAQALTQPESIVLNRVFESFSPDFCFNLHGQRTIFSAGKRGKPATLSFLSPAADEKRTITPERTKAMQLIVAINQTLQTSIPDQIGRYDDTFNPNCVGDRFTSLGVPTLLYEAGHYELDYDRNFTKEMILKALIVGLKAIHTDEYLNYSVEEYHNIPKNEKDFVDLIIQNVDIKMDKGIYRNQELAVQYKEEKTDNGIYFNPVCHSFGAKLDLLAHRKVEVEEIMNTTLINYTPNKSIEIF
jgi:hypothetical protein